METTPTSTTAPDVSQPVSTRARFGPATRIVQVGAILAALGVGLGAFGAHGLEGSIEPRLLEVFKTGVQYQMYAALAILALGAIGLRRGPWSLVIGTVLFSGSLYLLALTGIGVLGIITPFGGVAMIIGFLLAAWDCKKLFSSPR